MKIQNCAENKLGVNLKIMIKYKEYFGPNKDAFFVREKVFINECGVSRESEYDEYDRDSYQIVIYVDDMPVATGRMFLDNGVDHIGRICVLKEFRGKGLAEIVVGLLLKKAQEDDTEKCYLTGRTYVLQLYRNFGFKETGEPFIHDDMEQYSMYVSKKDIIYPKRFTEFIKGICG